MNKYHVIIPAAGHGSRFRGSSGVAKQYVELGGVPVIKRSIDIFSSQAYIEFIYVVVSPEDRDIESLGLETYGGRVIVLRVGGDSRAKTIKNALIELNEVVDGEDWILVHDAARPLITAELIHKLISSVDDDDVGGLLATPITDTLKITRGDRVVEGTVSRTGMWAAQTPQMFRFGLLLQALNSCDLRGITDESGAIEAIGLKPLVVESSVDNIKITYQRDLQRAEVILRGRAK